MPNYNYLKNNESDFPHISNIDTYKYDNDFDYGRFDYTQMRLILCTVPWDMGEAHIGNRTISGIGNVVYFGSKAQRDAWFDAIPDSDCYRFETKFKELHRDHIIDVPVPYDMCAKHNYLVVRYSKFANEDSPVRYEGNDGLREWFWFVREVEFVAPNTTRLHLLDDAFQTWIYDVNISSMILERGHAPMFEINATDYLKNPIGNAKNLLTEDVNFGDADITRDIEAVTLNGASMYACIATTANPSGTWGSKAGNDWNVPASSAYSNQGAPSVYVFATAASNLSTLLANIDSSCPQFKQTIQAVFFASDTLLTLAGNFTFCSVTCYGVDATRKSLDLVTLSKSLFGYDAKYGEIAKLYTSPYAHIEICDENGDVDIVKIEDTSGKLKVSALLSIAYPFVKVDANITGVGGSASKTITFKNVSSHSITLSGKWYETLRSWNVPTFAVVQQASTEYDYSTHFDRAQRVTDYTTVHTNQDANADTLKANQDENADTLKTNEDAKADTLKTNQDANADTHIANTAAENTGNSAVTARSNLSVATNATITTTYNSASTTGHNLNISGSAQSTIAFNDMQAAVSIASGVSSAAMNATVAGAFGGPVGAATGIASGIVGGASTMASTAIANGLTAVQAAYAQGDNNINEICSNSKTNSESTNQQDTQGDITIIRNDVNTTVTANSAATVKANATRDQDTAKSNASNSQATIKANASRDQTTAKANAQREADRAQSAIDNDVKQAALRAPEVFGSWNDGETAVTKPMALFAHIVTQSDSAIASAGDEMLRYGYRFDRYWEFDGNWNIGKYFTYWKLRDFWVDNLNVPDMYMDRLRFFLFGGVTVWSDPAYIGKKSIYDNYS